MYVLTAQRKSLVSGTSGTLGVQMHPYCHFLDGYSCQNEVIATHCLLDGIRDSGVSRTSQH